MKTTPERLGEALQRARNQWRHRSIEPFTLPPATRQLAFTIAVSRESGAGGASVAREVGSRLNWPVYDRELLELISEESGLQKELLESLEEHETSRAAEWLESLFVPTRVTQVQFAHRLVHTLSALAARGHCIIVGRGLQSSCRSRQPFECDWWQREKHGLPAFSRNQDCPKSPSSSESMKSIRSVQNSSGPNSTTIWLTFTTTIL